MVWAFIHGILVAYNLANLLRTSRIYQRGIWWLSVVGLASSAVWIACQVVKGLV